MTIKNSIQMRFLLPVGAMVLLMSLFLIGRQWTVGDRQMRDMLRSQAALALEFDLAVREYISEHVRPYALQHADAGDFMPETMSTSYVARHVFDRVREKFPDYVLKFSSDDPRNPANRAGPEELRMIEYFRQNPDRDRWQGEIRMNGRPYFAHFSPRRMTADCLQCHGDPAAAPDSLIQRYGAQAGFRRPLGEIIALDTVAIPMEAFQKAAKTQMARSVLFVIAVLAALFLSIYSLFRRLVSRRLLRMAGHFRWAAKRNDREVFTPIALRGADEIGVVADSFNLLVRKLQSTCDTLEHHVDERTENLVQANRQLCESQQRLALHVQQTPLGVVEWDLDFRIVDWNPAAQAIFGYSRDEAVGLHGWELIVPERCRRQVENCWSKLLACRGGVRSTNENVTKDGRFITCHWYNTPLIDEQGKTIGVASLVQDISHQLQVEQSLVEATRQAQDASRAKSEFLANMSHEIRTPMNAIIGFSELLSAESISSQQREYVEMIRRSGDTLLSLINDILDFSKIESGRLDVEMLPCSLEEILHEMESMFRPRAREKGVDFEILQCDQLPTCIQTDPCRLRQCLINLTNNAVKFTEKGHIYLNVSLEQRDAEQFIRFDVEDTGIGIPEDRQEAIFESFTQADGSTNRRYGGTGLGLTITRRLAELLGGDLALHSQPGRGATFTLSLPLVAVSTADDTFDRYESAEQNVAPAAPRPTEAARILVAEDAPMNQHLIHVLLSRAGCSVTIVPDGLQAVDTALAEPFDLIFMDIQMPGMNGYDATRTLREKGVLCPIVALTAHAIKGDREKCLAAGCDDYITKPIRRECLNEVLARYLCLEISALSPSAES